MEKLKDKDGIKMLPLIWNIFLSKDEDFFMDPFSLRPLRHRCYFRRPKKAKEELIVYFHLSDEEKMTFGDLSPLPETINLYGAFNQLTVYQIKSFGNIRLMTKSEKTKFVKRVQERLAGKNVGDRLLLKPSPEEKAEALQKIQAGEFYCFKPLSYQFHVYERG